MSTKYSNDNPTDILLRISVLHISHIVSEFSPYFLNYLSLGSSIFRNSSKLCSWMLSFIYLVDYAEWLHCLWNSIVSDNILTSSGQQSLVSTHDDSMPWRIDISLSWTNVDLSSLVRFSGIHLRKISQQMCKQLFCILRLNIVHIAVSPRV